MLLWQQNREMLETFIDLRRERAVLSKPERALSRWTEAIGVVGVVASLIFVGIEIRQNTRAVRGATYQSLAESSMTLLFRIADSPEVGAQISSWGRGEELDAEVTARVEALVMAYLRHLENAYYQMEEGTLDPEFLDNWAGNPTFALPHVRDFWAQRRPAFGGAFREYFEDRWDL